MPDSREMVSLMQSLAGKFGPVIRPRSPKPADVDSLRLKTVLANLAKLRLDGLAMYLPLPLAELAHSTFCMWRAAIGSNRSGKSQFGAAEACRAWTGTDPYSKYVPTNGNALVVGRDWDHVGMMWGKCRGEGAYKIIRDEKTRMWRSVRPSANDSRKLDDYDLAYQEKWKDAPPFLSSRVLSDKNIAWEDRGKGQPRYVTFPSTGWKVHFRSSDANPAQGDHYHFVWLDEEMVHSGHYYEALRGLVPLGEKRGWLPKGIWTATSQEGNTELMGLIERSEEGAKAAELFNFLVVDNPYVSAEGRELWASLLPEEEREVRIEGKSALAGRRAYPMFDVSIHTCEPFEIPADWTRYVFLDPGRQHCGTIFVAVDPDEKHWWIYDGFDLRHSDAQVWAQHVRERDTGNKFEAIICDQRMGRETPPGSGDTVAETYWNALEEAGVSTRLRGSSRGLAGFLPGSDVVLAREEALVRALRTRVDGPFVGTSKFQLFKGRLPILERQIRNAAYDRKRPDKRAKYEEDVLVVTEYCAAYDPYYWPPEANDTETVNPAYASFQEKIDRQQREREYQF